MKSMNLVGEPIIDLLKKIAIPASTGTLFQTLYNIVDTFFAGKISPNALAAIAKSFPLYFIIIATGVGIVSPLGNNLEENITNLRNLEVPNQEYRPQGHFSDWIIKLTIKN